ncbi:dynein axonemal light chain 1-like isoform X2 [Pectinophora gossypiella]|uniref:dynein axonemal light chain 1-like isoform X2 n=1 Tax=Pectinophora gossypiella TaxID=13191 RepID=UPI00214F3B36|nr:dynein axonemal light chain 1-like isoform X2 [Pectinophora gossypiella]
MSFWSLINSKLNVTKAYHLQGSHSTMGEGKLSLSTNMIDKIAGIAGMKRLKILALGRNNIKSLAGIETVADSLEQLWISYNEIDKLKGIGALKNLQVFYMSNNLVKDWIEINRLQELPKLWDVVLLGNPIYDSLPDVDAVRAEISKRVPQITKLDGIPIIKL